MERDNYTRVTEVLSPFSGLDKIDPAILKNAADRGTRVHIACDCILKGDVPNPYSQDTEVDLYVQSFRQWYDPSREYIFPDRFYDDIWELTGECDFLYEDNGFVLVDLKTPASESKTWCLQGAAYANMAKEAGYNINRIEFIKLDKKGGAPKVYQYEMDKHYSNFLSCLRVYEIFYKNKRIENYLDYL